MNREVEINHLDSTEKRWFAIYTKYKCEKFVSALLDKKKIVSYVPLQTVVKKYQRKVKKYELPLINNYVFVHITLKEYIAVLETEYVYKFIRQGKNLISIPAWEIDVLKQIVGDIAYIAPVSGSGFLIGEEVEVVSGQLSGLSGKIVGKKGKRSFVIELKNIGFQFHVHIDMALLKPLKVKISA